MSESRTRKLLIAADGVIHAVPEGETASLCGVVFVEGQITRNEFTEGPGPGPHCRRCVTLARSIRARRIETPNERRSIEAVVIKVGGPSPWMRFRSVDGRGEFMLNAASFDLVRLAGKWLYERVIVHAYFVEGPDGRIEGGVCEDLDLVTESGDHVEERE